MKSLHLTFDPLTLNRMKCLHMIYAPFSLKKSLTEGGKMVNFNICSPIICICIQCNKFRILHTIIPSTSLFKAKSGRRIADNTYGHGSTAFNRFEYHPHLYLNLEDVHNIRQRENMNLKK